LIHFFYLFIIERERDDPFSLHIILVTGVRIVVLVKRWLQQCVVVQLVQGLCAMLVDWCGQTRYSLMLSMLECYSSFWWIRFSVLSEFPEQPSYIPFHVLANSAIFP
jgi:hypothetical protein